MEMLIADGVLIGFIFILVLHHSIDLYEQKMFENMEKISTGMGDISTKIGSMEKISTNRMEKIYTNLEGISTMLSNILKSGTVCPDVKILQERLDQMEKESTRNVSREIIILIINSSWKILLTLAKNVLSLYQGYAKGETMPT